MRLTLFAGDDGKQKLYIVMEGDKNKQWYVYEKDYIKDPKSKWSQVLSDEKYPIALQAELDSPFEYPEYREAKLYHCASLCKQIQAEMEKYLNTGGPLPQNLKDYHECKSSISGAVDAIMRYDQNCPDLDSILDYYYFFDDWKQTYGDKLFDNSNQGPQPGNE